MPFSRRIIWTYSLGSSVRGASRITHPLASTMLPGARSRYNRQSLKSCYDARWDGTIYVFTTAEGFGLFKNTSKNNLLERRVERP